MKKMICLITKRVCIPGLLTITMKKSPKTDQTTLPGNCAICGYESPSNLWKPLDCGHVACVECTIESPSRVVSCYSCKKNAIVGDETLGCCDSCLEGAEKYELCISPVKDCFGCRGRHCEGCATKPCGRQPRHKGYPPRPVKRTMTLLQREMAESLEKCQKWLDEIRSFHSANWIPAPTEIVAIWTKIFLREKTILDPDWAMREAIIGHRSISTYNSTLQTSINRLESLIKTIQIYQNWLAMYRRLDKLPPHPDSRLDSIRYRMNLVPRLVRLVEINRVKMSSQNFMCNPRAYLEICHHCPFTHYGTCPEKILYFQASPVSVPSF